MDIFPIANSSVAGIADQGLQRQSRSMIQDGFLHSNMAIFP